MGAPGRKASILRSKARADRDHAPRFLGSGNTGKAGQRIQYPAPTGPPQGFRGQCRPNHLPGLRWDLTGICQPARAPPPTAPGRYFRHSPNDNTRRSQRIVHSSLARRFLNSWNAFKRQLSCAPRSRPRSGSVSRRQGPAVVFQHRHFQLQRCAPAWTPTPSPCPGPGGRPTGPAPFFQPVARCRRRPPRRHRRGLWSPSSG